MNFQTLYDQNRAAVERLLTSMWCGEATTPSQQTYGQQIRHLIREVFAPEMARPVVQCMNLYQPVHSVSPDEAKRLVGTLWRADYPPYEHQYQCWDTLLRQRTADGKPKSIVVTTGTGSGKTECFMLPLIQDLSEQFRPHEVQAIFLYPLNALMEDQRERLEELLQDTPLTYTVYNSDLPEREPRPEDTSPEAQQLRRQIQRLRGITVDEQGNESAPRYPKMLYTRAQIRKTPPNILLTNPTMLEYILLRGLDQNLIHPERASLRWVVIDETHSYTGAGAAELAMLVRRVLLAFGTQADHIRFATSSATFGNATAPEQKRQEEQRLKEFIGGITGLPTHQIVAIGGQRKGEETITPNQDQQRWRTICQQDFVSLDSLFPDEKTVSDMLARLEEMCQREEALTDKSPADKMKAKVHFFYRVPNNGLYVRLTEQRNGAFVIHHQNALKANGEEAPMLELCRCQKCGEYIIPAFLDTRHNTYSPLLGDDSDMFDLQPLESDAETDQKLVLLALATDRIARGDGNASLQTEGNTLLECGTAASQKSDWRLIGNTQYCCPHCNARLTHQGDDENLTQETFSLLRFRVSTELIARTLAPSILEQVEPLPPEHLQPDILHDGQQFLSFVDSRQAAAKATLNQNLQQERMWVNSTIFHELCRRKAEEQTTQETIRQLRQRSRDESLSDEELDDIHDEISRLKKRLHDGMTWTELADLLMHDRHFPIFCLSFIKRSQNSEEIEASGSIPQQVQLKYVHSVLAAHLERRPLQDASAETLGLFHVTFPQLAKIKELPQAVQDFNQALPSPADLLSLQDWKDLLQVFLDYTVRTQQAFFLQLDDQPAIDIFAIRRFAVEWPHRRPATPPAVDSANPSRIIWYLGALLASRNASRIPQAISHHQYLLQRVIDALWLDLTKTTGLLQWGTFIDRDSKALVKEKQRENGPEPYRLNLASMSFRLYDQAYLCNTACGVSSKAKVMRPIANHFKDFSPYQAPGTLTLLDERLHEEWPLFPFFHAAEHTPSTDELHAWARQNRKLLWEHDLWGENGTFMYRLEQIYRYPRLFIQAEHTAQVDKNVARTLQEDFRRHAINILACSTTMEMGVDLGSLEVVMLSSVPPQPANYKQRAGRSGRNNRIRSVCITLCSSDAIGLRTLYNPLERIIFRPVEVPTVDLQSPQIIQRHVNSFLIRAFGVYAPESSTSLSQKVVDFYTPYRIQRKHNSRHLEIVDDKVHTVEPSAALGTMEGTLYHRFDCLCDSKPDLDRLTPELTHLLHGTCFENQLDTVIRKAKEDNLRCRSELSTKAEDLKYAYNEKLRQVPENCKPKFKAKLQLQYLEMLNERLIGYWATHRFTPNANMPVNIVTLDLSGSQGDFFVNPSANPSYTLRDALSQYAPGNHVVVDGNVFVVRGIEYVNMYRTINSFKKIYHNTETTAIDQPSLPAKLRWNVNDLDHLELITPTSFTPDGNETCTRILDNNLFTKVSAQLIDTSAWSDDPNGHDLLSVRNNRDTGDAKILYYNEGTGHGYCFCARCGRMVLEADAADPNRPGDLPPEMNNLSASSPSRPHYHLAIAGSHVGSRCEGSSNASLIHRNVIIGDLMQTDYSEIRLRLTPEDKWLNARMGHEDLLYTLGIALTQSLAEVLGKERNAIEFAITPNGHICIFDTNPGGAGYANQLRNHDVMQKVIDNATRMLDDAQHKNADDMLLDRNTIRYLKHIDIPTALKWLHQQQEEANGEPR